MTEMNRNNQSLPTTLPSYQPPTITTYTSHELLDLIGPVQAGSLPPGDDILDLGYYAPEDDGGGRLI
ncbi:MAG: hypothetical protein AAF702_20090 [Chloroflexota bacterium]